MDSAHLNIAMCTFIDRGSFVVHLHQDCLVGVHGLTPNASAMIRISSVQGGLSLNPRLKATVMKTVMTTTTSGHIPVVTLKLPERYSIRNLWKSCGATASSRALLMLPPILCPKLGTGIKGTKKYDVPVCLHVVRWQRLIREILEPLEKV
jgi:hypothetical protein